MFFLSCFSRFLAGFAEFFPAAHPRKAESSTSPTGCMHATAWVGGGAHAMCWLCTSPEQANTVSLVEHYTIPYPTKPRPCRAAACLRPACAYRTVVY